jgi:hypothetical protein
MNSSMETCLVCNGMFVPRDGFPRRFCSFRCSGSWGRGHERKLPLDQRLIRVCVGCGREVSRNNTKGRIPNYCSASCEVAVHNYRRSHGQSSYRGTPEQRKAALDRYYQNRDKILSRIKSQRASRTPEQVADERLKAKLDRRLRGIGPRRYGEQAHRWSGGRQVICSRCGVPAGKREPHQLRRYKRTLCRKCVEQGGTIDPKTGRFTSPSNGIPVTAKAAKCTRCGSPMIGSKVGICTSNPDCRREYSRALQASRPRMSTSPRAERACDVCGITFGARTNQRFCGDRCATRHKANKRRTLGRMHTLQRVCKTCGIFIARRYAKRYCSDACRDKQHTQVTLTKCRQCGGKIERIGHKSPRQFCSHHCKGVHSYNTYMEKLDATR